MDDATRNGQTPTAAETVELDTAPRPVVATIPHASRAARKSSQPLRIVATGGNLLSSALLDLTLARRAERRERLRAAFGAAVECALERRAQLFVVAGDLFASQTPENQDRAFVGEALARLREAGVTCVAVAGPHDAGSGASEGGPYQVYASGDRLRFFSQRDVLQPALVVIDGVRVAVAGVSATPHAGGDGPEKLRIDDRDDALGRADLAVLVLPTPLESPGDRQVDVTALPSTFRLLITGGAPRFGKTKVGKREVVAPGASERHSFETPANSAGFAWVELSADGVTLAEHVRTDEQPRVEVEITTAQLFAAGDKRDETEEESSARSGVHLLPVLTPEEMMAQAEGADTATPYVPPPPDAEREQILARVLDALKDACRTDTMVRARLAGSLTRRQLHHLPLAETLRFGQHEAFSFELDTSGLGVVEPAHNTPSPRPLSLDAEIDQLVAEYRARLAEHEREARADVDAAAQLLRARLQTATGSSDREGAR
jgi:hypothetical protein